MINTFMLTYIEKLLKMGYLAPDIKIMVEKEFGERVTERTIYRAVSKIKKSGVQITASKMKRQKTDAMILVEDALSKGLVDKAIINVADDLAFTKKNQTLVSLSDLVSYALALKKRILTKVDEDLMSETITPLDASKVINNLGLNAINVAKMLGVQVDGTQNIQMKAEGVDEKGEDSQVKFYLPDNNR